MFFKGDPELSMTRNRRVHCYIYDFKMSEANKYKMEYIYTILVI